MEAHSFLLQLFAILFTARLCGELAGSLSIPPVLGELFAGVLLGPSLLGWIEINDVIRMLAEIGIILLLFDVGLETDSARLLKSGRQASLVALGGFAFPFILGFGCSFLLFDMPVLTAMFIGGTLTATSIGVTMRVLCDLHHQNSPEAQIILGAAVLDDVMGVVLLALLYEFSTGGGISLVNAGQVLLFIAVFFSIAPIAAKGMSLIIRRYESVSETPGLIPTTVVSLVLFFAWLANTIGAPELLGGFAAGLALSRRFFLPFGIAIHTDATFAHNIETQMRPITQLFTPIFFVTVGLSLDLRDIDWGEVFFWALSLTLLLTAVIGKLGGALLATGSLKQRLTIGLAMMPRGEVGLIFAELGQESGILGEEVYAALIIVIALTTLAGPLLLKQHYNRMETL